MESIIGIRLVDANITEELSKVANDYFAKLSVKELGDSSNVMLILKAEKDIDSHEFMYVLQHQEELKEKPGTDQSWKVAKMLNRNALAAVREAGKNNDLTLFAKALGIIAVIKPDSRNDVLQAKLYYYEAAEQWNLWSDLTILYMDSRAWEFKVAKEMAKQPTKMGKGNTFADLKRR